MKNLSGQKRWIVLKELPRRQDNNPKLRFDADSASTQDQIRLNRLKSETLVFATDEILVTGIGDLENSLFSFDNDHKYCCNVRSELPYLIEQGFIQELPHSRKEIENLKENWLKDPIFDLYEFPGCDEYWDELAEFQKKHETKRKLEYAAKEEIARKVADLEFSDLNYELVLIALISAREPDPKACIKQAKDIIFEIANEQFIIQKREVKDGKRTEAGNPTRKKRSRKQPSKS